MKSYPGYKSGTNSRGLNSKDVKHPDVSNESFTKNGVFVDACKAASEELGREIKPTKRQASKFRNKQGAAWAAHVSKKHAATAAATAYLEIRE